MKYGRLIIWMYEGKDLVGALSLTMMIAGDLDKVVTSCRWLVRFFDIALAL